MTVNKYIVLTLFPRKFVIIDFGFALITIKSIFLNDFTFNLIGLIEQILLLRNILNLPTEILREELQISFRKLNWIVGIHNLRVKHRIDLILILVFQRGTKDSILMLNLKIDCLRGFDVGYQFLCHVQIYCFILVLISYFLCFLFAVLKLYQFKIFSISKLSF